MDSGIVLWWIFCAIIGGAIGMAKDRVVSGVIWGGLLGPIGIIVVLCLPNLKKQKEEEAATKQQLTLQLQRQHAQLETYNQVRRSSRPPPPGNKPMLRIASNGQDLGDMPVATVKLMIQSGKLSPQDYYFDAEANDWMQLDCCTALV